MILSIDDSQTQIDDKVIIIELKHNFNTHTTTWVYCK